MTLDEGIKHEEELVKRYEKDIYKLCAEEHRRLAEWLKELRVFKARKGKWLKMSDEQEDDRYKCSRCGNVVHYKDKTNLYTFNNWCGRCGSDNTNSTPIYGYFMSERRTT